MNLNNPTFRNIKLKDVTAKDRDNTLHNYIKEHIADYERLNKLFLDERHRHSVAHEIHTKEKQMKINVKEARENTTFSCIRTGNLFTYFDEDGDRSLGLKVRYDSAVKLAQDRESGDMSMILDEEDLKEIKVEQDLGRPEWEF